MTVQIDDVLRVSARQTFANAEDDMVGVFHYGVSVASETDEQTLLNIAIVIEAVYAFLNPRVFQDVAYEEISVKNVTQNKILGDTPWPVLTNGVLAGDALPPQVVALVLGSTASPTRQGRKYFGGFEESDNDGGVISTTLLTALTNAADQYVLTVAQGGITYRPLIMTSPDGPAQPTFPLDVGKVITAFRTQRRRTKVRGS